MTTTTADLRDTARLFQALSDPTRLEILRRLGGGERCVCELQDALDAAQSRLSFHLRQLRDAGLVSDRREGRWVYYALRPEVLEALGDVLVALREVRESDGCCSAVVDSAGACCG